MSAPESADTTPPTPRNGAAEAEPWRLRASWSLLPAKTREPLAVLFRFIAAVRAVADHPALSPERKEAALAALAAPFSLGTEPTEAGGHWAEPARALADTLAGHGIDARPAWQILQAAGQDLRKARYRDWSDLLVWCRFAAAPAGRLVFKLAGAVDDGLRRAESLAIALQLIDCVRRAQSHYRWLKRVYLPERWFAEARGAPDDLGFARVSPSLRIVLDRALDQAASLLDEGAPAIATLPDWRARAAGHAALLEAHGEIRALRRMNTWKTPSSPSGFARRMTLLRASIAALRAG